MPISRSPAPALALQPVPPAATPAAAARPGAAPSSVGWALASLSRSMLLAARLVQGAGAAVMLTLSMAFVGQTVPKSRVGSAMGLLGRLSAAGTALGPTPGGLLITGLGWQAIFGALNPSPLAAAAALAALFVWVESRVASLLIRLAMFRDPALRAALGSHALVSTVVKATRVVGPFYLARGLSG